MYMYIMLQIAKTAVIKIQQQNINDARMLFKQISE